MSNQYHSKQEGPLKASSLAKGVCEALRAGGGTSLLAEPNRFVSILQDVSDTSSNISRTLVTQCDNALLDPYIEALSTGPTPSRDTLVLATDEATNHLANDKGVDRYASRAVANALVNGLALYLGLPLVAREQPSSSQAAPHAPQTKVVSTTQPAGTAFPGAMGEVNDDSGLGVVVDQPTYAAPVTPPNQPFAQQVPNPYTGPNVTQPGYPPTTYAPPVEPYVEPQKSGAARMVAIALCTIASIAALGLAAFVLISSQQGKRIEVPFTSKPVDSEEEPLDQSVLDNMNIETIDNTTNDGSRILIMKVHNNSGRTVDLTSHTYYNSSGGDTVTDWVDTAPSFAPGDDALFICPVDNTDGTDMRGGFTYNLEARLPDKGKLSLLGRYRIEEVSRSYDVLTIRITNTSSDRLSLQGVRTYAAEPGGGDQGGFAFYDGVVSGTTRAGADLDPGESITVTFGSSGDKVQWQSLNPEYYLVGYATNA